jgi:hypothetical protein
MLLMRAASITRASERGWALEISTFLGPELLFLAFILYTRGCNHSIRLFDILTP